jgi:hypothetical protein
LVLLAFAAMALSSCGGGANASGSTGGGTNGSGGGSNGSGSNGGGGSGSGATATPAGSYTITVTGNFSNGATNLSQTVELTLVVQ